MPNPRRRHSAPVQAQSPPVKADSPCILLIDFASAFPSLSRKFVGDAVTAIGMPRGARRLVGAMLRPAWTEVGIPGSPETGFSVAGGVPQGSPLSGALFAAASVSLVKMIAQAIGEDRTFAYADDVAVVLRSVQELRKIADILQVFADATSLQVKPEKCVVVPLKLDAEGFQATQARYRLLIAQATPEWTSFRVEAEALYLGVLVDPGASRRDQWSAPLAKMQQRVGDLATAKLAPSLTAQMFATRATPVLSYVGQVIPASAEVRGSFCVAVTRLWHIPLRSLPEPALRPLRAAGAPIPPHVTDRLQATFQASQRRLAPVAEAAMALLTRARDDFDPLAALACGGKHADEVVWGTAAFCSELTAPQGEDAHDAAARRGKELRALRRRAIAASRHGGRAPEATCHAEAAEALGPRLMRWREAAGMQREEMLRAAARTLASLTACAPAVVVAVVKTWCDGWPTSVRHGRKADRCPACGRQGHDEVAHLIRCPKLTRAVESATHIAGPQSVREALCLVVSQRAPSTCEKFARPGLRELFLAV